MRRYQKPKDESIQIEVRIGPDELERMVREGLEGLALEIGVDVARHLIEGEVERQCGPRNKTRSDKRGQRYGRQGGWIRIAGQKVRIQRPRVRSSSRGEVELQTYKALQKDPGEGVMRRLVRGVSCRNYKQVIEAIRRGHGVAASSISRSFVSAAENRVRELLERSLEGERFVVIFIDGVIFAKETVIVALGVTAGGEKRVLSLRHGATENAQVCTNLLEDLRERGIATDRGMLFVIDGSKALRSAIRRVWGDQAEVQRCQQHKLRNVRGYVPKKHWPEASRRIRSAYREKSYAKAKRSLENTARWLEWINPHAAESLREGLEETITVTRLRLSGKLRRCLSTTNTVEGLFSRARMMTARVKRWRPGGMRQRWCAAALLHAESSFNRVHGHAQISKELIIALDRKLNTLNRKSA